jgi:hypothetical protein
MPRPYLRAEQSLLYTPTDFKALQSVGKKTYEALRRFENPSLFQPLAAME